MIACPACARPIPDDQSVCHSCGAALSNTSTPTKPPPTPSKSPPGKGSHSAHKSATAGLSSSGALDQARFVPGTMLAERYRIVGLLGKGGMGEVYRAEDLRLEQVVALKFLPDSLATDGAMLARFHGEVRVARQITHPNVCRVHDIGEVEKRQFISMEFIDGEDLSSLLRRIGRLPGDKAVEIARQLCAGLAAAHDVGVLHRDLKPANVMIDGRGKVRITDFGLAGLAEEFRGDEVRAGTPAYMSPEQLIGKEVTSKSDLYALGLVLYEVFTGKRAFEASTVAELVRLQEQTTPTNPSNWVKEIDPLAERVILRCLDKDPQKRPASAMQVAAALPGGDPLAAALAAGEMPSPEMVAAAGEKTGLRPMVAVAYLLAIIIGMLGLAYLSHRTSLIERVPFENSPEVLSRKGREIAAQLGYPERPFDSAYGLHLKTDYLDYIEEKDKSPDRWKRLENGRGEAVHFWYRESPSTLTPVRRFGWSVEFKDPYIDLPGMVVLEVDPLGRLLNFLAKPPQVEESTSAKSSASSAAALPAPEWRILFTLAGLEMSRFTPADPQWTPESVCDARAAWTGTSAETPDLPLRLEAASYHGKFVFFQLIYPWTKPPVLRPPWYWSNLVQNILLAVILLGAVLLARDNYKRGKGDRRGAKRLAYVIFISLMLAWLFMARHILTNDELNLLVEGVRSALFWSAAIWVLYLALEPYVRRRWPTSLITWSRVLDGKLTDPLVGRDLLIGMLAGMGFELIFFLRDLGVNKPLPYTTLSNLLGLRFVIGDFFFSLFFPIMFALGVIFMDFPLASLPLTTNFSTWYAGTTLFAMGMVVSLAVFAFRTSLGGQKVFEGKLLEN